MKGFGVAVLAGVAILGTVLAEAVVGAEKVVRKTPPPVKCGYKVAVRSELNYKFLTTHKDLSITATSGIPGIPELFVISCKTKDNGEIIEQGDQISLRSERSGKFANDAASDHLPMSADPRRARGFFSFFAFDPIDPQARGTLLLETPFALRSARPGLMTYARLAHGKSGKIVFDSDNLKGGAEVRFRLYKFPHDVDGYKAACPKDGDGKVCSGNGVCVDRECDCNDDAVGERCELLREEAECSAIGDVHIESFDGGLYNVYELGEFLMYRENHSKFREAVAGFISPWQRVNNSAVLTQLTIRRADASGEDFLSFSDHGTRVTYNCDDAKDFAEEIRRAGQVGKSFKNGLRVQWDNSMWKVTSPSRLVVHIRPRPRLKLLDAVVSVNTPRLGTAEGLCGNNDKNPENDLSPRMKSRFRNEPSAKLLRRLSVEDGRVYPYAGTELERKNGYDSGRRSVAYYQCRAKARTIDGAGGKKLPLATTAVQLDAGDGGIDVPPERRNEVRTSIETALSAGYCAKSPRMQDSAVACCRQVLVKARAITGTEPAPTAQLKLDMDVNDAVLGKAWEPFKGATIPSAAIIKGDYISCATDICKTRTSKFCTEEKQDVELQRGIKGEEENILKEEAREARLEMEAER